jgi:hypothetical protein
MPASRPEKFTVTQTGGLAQNRIFFPTENEPIYRYRPGPQATARRTFRQTTNYREFPVYNSKNRSKQWIGHADTRERLPRFHSFVRPIRYKTKPFLTRHHHARVLGVARKNKQVKKPICNALARAVGVRKHPRRPRAPAIQSNSVEPAYCNAYSGPGPGGPPDSKLFK